MEDKRLAWAEMVANEQRQYRDLLDRIDVGRVGVKITCPGCHEVSWVKLPETAQHHLFSMISCPRACGTFGLIEEFGPIACEREAAGEFDTDIVCKGDGTKYAANGVVLRCPLCAIENPRQVIAAVRLDIARRVGSAASVEDRADLVARLMSVFDGVMREQNRIAVKNVAAFNEAKKRGEAGSWEIDGPEVNGEKVHPSIGSFQNITSARDKLLSAGWDMATASPDWDRFVMLVNKRHLFAHRLGVADEAYRKKSGDTTTPVGKKVSVSAEDVSFFGESAEAIVKAYFGCFLS